MVPKWGLRSAVCVVNETQRGSTWSVRCCLSRSLKPPTHPHTYRVHGPVEELHVVDVQVHAVGHGGQVSDSRMDGLHLACDAKAAVVIIVVPSDNGVSLGQFNSQVTLGANGEALLKVDKPASARVVRETRVRVREGGVRWRLRGGSAYLTMGCCSSQALPASVWE